MRHICAICSCSCASPRFLPAFRRAAGRATLLRCVIPVRLAPGRFCFPFAERPAIITYFSEFVKGFWSSFEICSAISSTASPRHSFRSPRTSTSDFTTLRTDARDIVARASRVVKGFDEFSEISFIALPAIPHPPFHHPLSLAPDEKLASFVPTQGRIYHMLAGCVKGIWDEFSSSAKTRCKPGKKGAVHLTPGDVARLCKQISPVHKTHRAVPLE